MIHGNPAVSGELRERERRGEDETGGRKRGGQPGNDGSACVCSSPEFIISLQVKTKLKGEGGVAVRISVKSMMDSQNVDRPLVLSLHDDIISTV